MSSLAQNQSTLFTQKELSELASSDAKSVLAALADEKWDFRTTEGISKETGLSEEQVNKILQKLSSVVRKSPVRDRFGRPLYALRARQMKPAEMASFIRLLLAKAI